jgi:hypothetical protein
MMPSLDDIIADAMVRAATAYLRYASPIPRGQTQRDIWVTTSPNPCRFCVAIASLSEITNVPVGGPFVIPIWVDIPYNSLASLTFAREPPAHPNCQCQRASVTFFR